MSSKPIVNSDKQEKTKNNQQSNPSKQQNVNKKKDEKKSSEIRETVIKISQPLAGQASSILSKQV